MSLGGREVGVSESKWTARVRAREKVQVNQIRRQDLSEVEGVILG